MNRAIDMVKAIVPVSMKARARYILSRSFDEQIDQYRGKQKVVVALAADYGNLGDVAITYAQEEFLRSCVPGYAIVDFPISSTFTRLKALKNVVTPEDIVTIVGGGNMGDLHYTIEDCRRFVIQSFPGNRIISFPQTITFSDNTFGKHELQKTIEVYRKHENLHLFARESVSYDIMKKCFPNNYVYLAPDIVLSLDKSKHKRERQGVMLCIRNDVESAFPGEERSAFMRSIVSALPDHFEVDTHIGKDGLTVREREVELFKILESFIKTEVVITDRLHGMIFAAITGTPCVVLQNYNHKIKATYETWLRQCDYIRLQENFQAVETLRIVTQLKKSEKVKRELPHLGTHFEALKRVIIGQ